MSCTAPLTAYMTASGAVVFNELARHGDFVRQLLLPCGRCMGCRLERSRQWAVRCMHEKQLHDLSCYLTLTWSDEYLPRDLSLSYRPFQLFMKRLRKQFGDGVRFFMCGEYGDLNGRPHYHAVIFGCDFADKVYYCRNEKGQTLFTSASLSKLWPFGMATLGEVTFESAAYVARYITKKVTGDLALAHYESVDLVTGEIYNRMPEFCQMSRRPGIGANWFKKFGSDVYPHDYVVVRGSMAKPPRYYDKLLRRVNKSLLDDIKVKRELDGYARRGDNTDARLKVKAEVTAARVNRYKRIL